MVLNSCIVKGCYSSSSERIQETAREVICIQYQNSLLIIRNKKKVHCASKGIANSMNLQGYEMQFIAQAVITLNRTFLSSFIDILPECLPDQGEIFQTKEIVKLIRITYIMIETVQINPRLYCWKTTKVEIYCYSRLQMDDFLILESLYPPQLRFFFYFRYEHEKRKR